MFDEYTLARFWAKAERQSNGCLVWIGASNKNGYGVFAYQGKTYPAHRFAYMAAYGPIPIGKMVLHSCDVRGCIDPDHLSAGTAADNARDCVSRGRHGGWRKLDKNSVVEIRLRHSKGASIAALAREHRVSEPTVHSVVRYKTWKDV